MKIFRYIVCLGVLITMFPFNLFAKDPTYEELWAKVEKAAEDSLPQTMVKELEPIIEKATKENETAWAIKAICRKVIAEGEVQGNLPEEKIIRFEKVIEKSNKQLKPILKVILAKWYHHYYSRNRYRFLRRTATENLDSKDFKTWDLPKLFSHIGNLYNNVLENEEELIKIPISKFDGFLEAGNQPAELRSNLFEFLAHDALEFFKDEDQTTAKPQNAFEIDADSKVFADVNEFVNWKPETSDQTSANYNALRIYQRILALNIATNNRNALVVNDIDRIRWAKNVSVGSEKEYNYVKALLNVVNNNEKCSYSATAMYYIASHYRENGNNVKALEFCDKAINSFPESYGANKCSILAYEIRQPNIYFESEKIINPDYNKIRINFKNLDHAYFKIIKRTEEEVLDSRTGADNYDEKLAKKILSAKPSYTFDTELAPGSEYKNLSKDVSLPKLSKGFYWIVASAKSDYSFKENAIGIGAFIVSDLAVIKRQEKVNGKHELFVVNAKTGEPIANADCKFFTFRYNKGYTKTSSEKTDKNGKAKINGSNENSLLLCTYKDDKIYTETDFYRIGDMNHHNDTSAVYFFTDRSIYRPGQTVYFKAIAVNNNKDDNKYSVIPNKDLEVVIKDPNRQVVKTIKLKTNEFGSCSGSFISPADRLTGTYRITASNPEGYTYIKIEEYKRPKFKVSIDTPTEEYQLGQTVKLKGNAKAYTGASIDNATVKFRVTRQARYPFWCWWRTAPSSAQEIKHGVIKTDAEGNFEIAFEAKPDKSLEKKDDPLFTYEISADVTDNSGETRSASAFIRLAYTAINLNVASEQTFNSNKTYSLQLSSETHNGNKVKANGRYQIIELNQPDKPQRHTYAASDVSNSESAVRNMTEGKVIVEDNFETDSEGSFTKDLMLNEGIYKVKVTSQDKYGAEVKTESIIMAINYESEQMTIKLPFFCESITENLKPGDTYKGFWATGYKAGPAYVEIVHRNKVLKSYWTEPNKNKQFITYPVTEELRGGFTLRVFQVKENRLYESTKFISVPWSNKNLNIKLVHFNSKMEPGSKESWKLEVSGEKAEINTIEMLASMYDSSLDAYAKQAYWKNIGDFYIDCSSINNSFSNMRGNISLYKRDFYKAFNTMYVEYTSFPSEIVEDFYYNNYGPKIMYDDMTAESAFIGQIKGSRGLMKNTAPMMMSRSLNSVRATQGIDSENSTDSIQSYSSKAENGNIESSNEEELDLSKVTARTNLNETAFFQPHLSVNSDGIVTIDFDMPEALTTWKFRAYAHGKENQVGIFTQEVVTQKELMIQPNAPRFLREKDKLEFAVKVTNLSEQEQSGQISLNFLDAISEESRDAEFKNIESKKDFTLTPGQSKGIIWNIEVPLKPGFVKYKAVGSTKTCSDGEEGLLPILSSRVLVTESLPLPINGPAEKEFKFDKLIESKNSKTLEHKDVTVEITSNPAWYAVQALPYLIEFPHECSEQTFNRIYANKLAQYIANSDKRIRNLFNIWLKDEQYNKGTALKSNLEKNQHLKDVTLMETPWVLDSKNESEQKHNIGVLFEESRLEKELESASKKLKEMQGSDGSFPWFPGGHPNVFITNYIMSGYGRLRQAGCDIDLSIALNCADYMDKEIVKWYERIIKIDDYKNKCHLDSFIAFYLYGRTFFLKDKKIQTSSKTAFDFFVSQAKKYWAKLNNRMGQAHIAIALQRLGEKEIPVKIVNSIKEHSVVEEEMGRFWREDEIGFSWNKADIETQAMMIELFSEVTNDEKAVSECKIWLLKQKQTQAWKTTKATADAIYSLILRGTNLLSSDKLVKVKLGNLEIKPEKVEAGTGYYEKIFTGNEVNPEMGSVKISKEDNGVAWGAVHWQYLEDMNKVTPFENNLKLKKTLFLKENTEKGSIIKPVENGNLQVGDLVVVRIELKSDRDLEFVHMKDQRGSGMEPVNVLSRYKWQDGLGYYEATKDAASHFYIDYLPKGTYVFEYEVRIQLAGEYQTGFAEIQCMYAPEFNSHSESFLLHVKQQ